MTLRLVLGCGDVCRRLLPALVRDSDAVVVVTTGDAPADTNARIVEGDPADSAVLAGLSIDPDSALLTPAVEEPAAAARAFRSAFGDRPLVCVVDGPAGRDSLCSHCDRIVDATAALASTVTRSVGTDRAEAALAFRRGLLDCSEPIAVVMHDNPDPDAIASAVGVSELAGSVGREAVPCYFGEINHQENRALVNLLELELRELTETTELAEFGSFVLVDHARPGVNDQLPTELAIDLVVDHHPPRGPIDGRVLDVRPDVGSTSTIVAEYFELLDEPMSTATATALLYGLRVDTDDFTREVSSLDFRIGERLVEEADHSVLERVETPTVSSDTLDTVARAIRNREDRGSIVISAVGRINDRDTLAQAAERLLTLEEITTTVVFGIVDETIYLSARGQGSGLDLGATLRSAFGQIGSAGGHTEMAGAQIPLGVLAEVDDDESLTEIVAEVVTERFFDALETRPVGRSEGIALDDDALSFLRSTVDPEEEF